MTIPRPNPQNVQPSKKFYPPKRCIDCGTVTQGTDKCPDCHSPLHP